MSIRNAFKKKYIPQWICNIIIIFELFIMLFPFAMALWNAFKTPNGYLFDKWKPSLPLRVKNLMDGFLLTKEYIFNTLFVAVIGIAGLIVLSSMASYALAKADIIGKKYIFPMIIVIMMIPSVLTLVPTFLLYRTLGLYNTIFALVLPMWTSGSVFAIFLTTNTFRRIPNEVFEAAEIDGAGMFKRYYLIAVPLSIPILGTIIIMAIVSLWNDLVWPMLIMNPDKYTISAGFAVTFNSVSPGQEPLMFASHLVASSPLIFLFIFANKFYIQGLMGSSIKM